MFAAAIEERTLPMTELHEIFAEAAPAMVFIYASAASLILCAVAALWLRRSCAGGRKVQ
jgi:hypothetical protein